MTDLPREWVEIPVGDVCRVVGGSTPKTAVDGYWGGGIPWLTPDDLARDRSQYVAAGRRYLTQAGYESCSTQLMPAGTVLFTSRAPIGYVAIAKGSVCTNQGFKSFVPTPAISSEYLYWYLVWATPSIRTLGSGTTFAEVSGKVATTIPVRLPPRAEQDRIVSAIEQHFSWLDAAEVASERAVAHLGTFRRSVIDQLWAEPCPHTFLSEVADIVAGPAFRSADFVGEGEGIRLLRGDNIEPGSLRWRDARCWPFAQLAGLDHLHIGEDDLILAMDRPVISSGLKLARAKPRDLPALLVQRVARIRLAPNADAGFTYLLLQHPSFVAHLLKGQTGTQIPHVTLEAIRSFRIPLPKIDRQRDLRQLTDDLLTVVFRTESAVQTARQRSRVMRRSILCAAFSGQLVPRNPDDEPVSMLLKRVRAERAVATPTKRKQKVTVS